MKTIILLIFLVVLIFPSHYAYQQYNEIMDSKCSLLYYLRADLFEWEKGYDNGKLISWYDNKDFNKLCGRRMDYRFPESLEELNDANEVNDNE